MISVVFASCIILRHIYVYYHVKFNPCVMFGTTDAQTCGVNFQTLQLKECFTFSFQKVSSYNLFSTIAYFRPPKTLPYKNLNTLNFAAVGVSLFSAGTALLDSDFLFAVKVQW